MQEINIKPIFESYRLLLIYTESVNKEIRNVPNIQLRNKLYEIFRTAQNDLLILTDF